MTNPVVPALPGASHDPSPARPLPRLALAVAIGAMALAVSPFVVVGVVIAQDTSGAHVARAAADASYGCRAPAE